MLNDERIRKLREHEPYKSLWNHGKGYDKDWAKRDIIYVWYVTSKESDNPYRNLQFADRKKEARRDCGYPDTWEFHPGIDNAIAKLKSLNQTTEERLLDAALESGEELVRYFERAASGTQIRDINGNIIPTVSPSELMKNLKDVGGVIKSLQSLREQAAKGAENKQVYGGANIGHFERTD